MVVNMELLNKLIEIKGYPEIVNDGLPSWCLVEDLAYSGLIIVEYGVEGYEQYYWMQGDRGLTTIPWYHSKRKQELERNQANEVLNVYPAQAEAMMIGSMMGWDVPGAKVSAYWPSGSLKHSKNTMSPTLNNPRASRLK